jgi:hypothetical protein
MYAFSIDILFKGSQSLAKITSKVTAVSYLHRESMTPLNFLKFAYLHSGVNDSAVHVTAESMTPLCMA